MEKRYNGYLALFCERRLKFGAGTGTGHREEDPHREINAMSWTKVTEEQLVNDLLYSFEKSEK